VANHDELRSKTGKYVRYLSVRGSSQGAGTPIRAHRFLVVLLLAAPTAGAHGLLDLGLVVPADCPEDACLTTVENQPVLHAGETVDVNVYNDDGEPHEIHVTTLDRADPDRNATPPEASLIASGELEPSASRALGELAIPAEADALYAWCAREGHEAAGEHRVVDLESPHADEPNRDTPAPGPVTVLAVLIALAVLWGRRARG
jgi:hypothetical protein